MTISLMPAEHMTPYRRFTLGSGRTYAPDFSKGGRVNVNSEQDAHELEAEGWTRAFHDRSLMRSAHEAALRHRDRR
jgi:hypothetical protein